MEDIQDVNAPWVFFFTGVSIADYPQVIEAAVQGVGSGFNAVGVNFPADLDDWDIEERGGTIPDNAVEIYHQDFGTTIMPQVTFYTILQAFAERMLERPGQPAAWYQAMQAALMKLRTKVKYSVNFL